MTEQQRIFAFDAAQNFALTASDLLTSPYQNEGAYCEREAKAAIAKVKSMLCNFERRHASFNFDEGCSGLGNGMDW